MSTEANGAAASKMQACTEFLEVWEGLRTEILADPMMVQKDAAAWMARMLDHTVPGGKLNRGMAVKDVLVAIRPDASDMDKLQADRLGWAIEFIQVRHHRSLSERILFCSLSNSQNVVDCSHNSELQAHRTCFCTRT